MPGDRLVHPANPARNGAPNLAVILPMRIGSNEPLSGRELLFHAGRRFRVVGISCRINPADPGGRARCRASAAGHPRDALEMDTALVLGAKRRDRWLRIECTCQLSHHDHWHGIGARARPRASVAEPSAAAPRLVDHTDLPQFSVAGPAVLFHAAPSVSDQVLWIRHPASRLVQGDLRPIASDHGEHL